MEAALGTSKKMTFQRKVECTSCGGTGVAAGKKLSKCSKCEGKGTHVFSRGGMIFEIPCDSCHGQGKANKDPCPSCAGSGEAKKEVTLDIKIPSGVDQGSQMVVRGSGHMLNGRKGDLQLHLQVEPSSMFKREGLNLYSTKTVSFVEAALGGTVPIRTLTGDVELILPAGTQPDALKKLRGKGIYDEDAKVQGDLFVTIQVSIPTRLTPRQKDLLLAFNQPDSSTMGHSKESHSENETEKKDKDKEKEKECSTGSGIKDWIKSKITGSGD